MLTNSRLVSLLLVKSFNSDSSALAANSSNLAAKLSVELFLIPSMEDEFKFNQGDNVDPSVEIPVIVAGTNVVE